MSSLDPRDRLRALVKASGLNMPVSLTVFNRGLGARALSVSAWKAWLSEGAPSAALVPLDESLLAHAERQFSRIAPAPGRGGR